MFETVSVVGYHQGSMVSLYLFSVPDIVHQICHLPLSTRGHVARARTVLTHHMVSDVRQQLGNLQFIVGPEGSLVRLAAEG
jgi:hypothetical protein